MTAHVKLAGTWDTVDQIYTRVGGSWKEVAEGYVKLSGSWKKFFESGVPLTVQYLVIAGGGGGGNGQATVYDGYGGGAGGYRSSVTGESSGGGAGAEAQLSLAVSTNYTVTVGAGGPSNTNGSNSVFSSITSLGGGRGAGANPASIGGSGGGNAAGTTGQGFAGLTNGGGGAGEAGGTDGNGQGGDGLSSSITGTAITRAGGGGSSAVADSQQGGLGGGGNGNTNGVGGAGTVNTGGGGGGSRIFPSGSVAGGAGGSGIVIIKYPDTYQANISAGLTHQTTTSGGFRVTQFLAGTGTISFSEAVDTSFELIATTYLSANQASVTFDVSGLGSRYQHLQVRMVTRGSNSNEWSEVFIRLNGDTGNNYADHVLRGTGSTVFSAAGTSRNSMRIETSGNTATANSFGVAVIDLLDVFEAKNKTIRTLWGRHTGSDNSIALNSGLHMSTSSLTSISFTNTANFLSGSRFSIYGIRSS